MKEEALSVNGRGRREKSKGVDDHRRRCENSKAFSNILKGRPEEKGNKDVEYDFISESVNIQLMEPPRLSVLPYTAYL